MYEIDESEYVRKAEDDEDVKEQRLQGLKDRLAASEEEEETDDLRREIEEFETVSTTSRVSGLDHSCRAESPAW